MKEIIYVDLINIHWGIEYILGIDVFSLFFSWDRIKRMLKMEKKIDVFL